MTIHDPSFAPLWRWPKSPGGIELGLLIRCVATAPTEKQQNQQERSGVAELHTVDLAATLAFME
jgi:hypothetical protein